MIVELDVFSGRPNPCWRLSNDDAAQVTRLIDSMPPTQTDLSSDPPGLGYRGFRLTDGTARYWAYRGSIRTPMALLADPDRRIERFLLAQLPAEFSELRGTLESDLGLV